MNEWNGKSSLGTELLCFGDEIIRETRALILDLWRKGGFASRLKSDETPVSEVDERCEELARSLISARYPEHGVIGEEFGEERPAAEFVWTIDPIDGTQNLINGIPTFGTIIGLLHRGRPVLGWIDHPVLGDTFRGGEGIGTFYNGAAVRLADLDGGELTANDLIGTNCPSTFLRGDHVEILWAILKLHPHSRIYYDVYAHGLAIRGALAVMVEYNLKIWDLTATRALIEAAGGVYRELGKDSRPGSPTAFHAAFGKPDAVDLVVRAIEGC